jgi:hypothetical protein
MVTKTIDVQANSLSLEELVTLLLDSDTELVLVKDDVPVARMSPIPPKPDLSQPRIAGLHRGTTWMSDDFDAPLPDEFWFGSRAAFEAALAKVADVEPEERDHL